MQNKSSYERANCIGARLLLPIYMYILCGSRHKYVCAIDIRIEIATRCVIRNLLPCREGRLVLVGVGVSAAICMCHTTPMFVQALCTLLCDCTHSVALCVCVCVFVSKRYVDVSGTSAR